MKKIGYAVIVILSLLCVYLFTQPVPIEPVSWKAPPNPGYTEPFAVNDRLATIETIPLQGFHGPEDIAIGPDGKIYAATHEGYIIRMNPDGTGLEKWANTKGRPLGIDFSPKGDLIVADAFRGLLAVSPSGEVKLLANEADRIPIRYADDVDTAKDGKIYFTDASMKFSAKDNGGTLAASLLDIMEHGGHGRLLVYDPGTGKATTLIAGLQFANGVAVSPDQSFVLVNETGNYRVIKYWLKGPKKGSSEIIISNLPGFPDNISTGMSNRFWVALVSPRNPLLDSASDKPWLRKIMQRIPAPLRPKPVHYGHIIAIDKSGKVLLDMQDPKGKYPMITSVCETEQYLYLGSLVTDVLGRIPKANANIN